jgi:hypothetical protein
MRRVSRAVVTAICAAALAASNDAAPVVNNLLEQIVAKIPQ